MIDISTLTRKVNLVSVGLFSVGPVDDVKSFFGLGGKVVAKRFPSPLTDPAVSLLDSDLAMVIGFVFFIAAIMTYVFSGHSLAREKAFKAVGITSLLTTCTMSIVGWVMIESLGKGDIPITRLLEVFSGAGVYGAGVWFIGMIVAFIVVPGVEKKEVIFEEEEDDGD